MADINKKAIILISGGLDSYLAAKLMQEQGVELVGLNFTSIFCTCTTKEQRAKGCASQAAKMARELGIPMRTLPKGMDYFKVVQSPKHGWGKGMNPCTDCRIYMLNKAKDIMKETGATFVVTGEVLDQRPMSQTMARMDLIDRESGLGGLILRPLCASHLPPTVPETEGVVDRSRLLSIRGRSRKVQLALARERGLSEVPCVSGGCMLADKTFAKRVRDLFEHKKDYDMRDLRLLKLGRHFRIDGGTKFIVGRNEMENLELESLAGSDLLFRPQTVPGPSALLDGADTPRNVYIVAKTVMRYGDDEGHRGAVVCVRDGGGDEKNHGGKVERVVAAEIDLSWDTELARMRI